MLVPQFHRTSLTTANPNTCPRQGQVSQELTSPLLRSPPHPMPLPSDGRAKNQEDEPSEASDLALDVANCHLPLIS